MDTTVKDSAQGKRPTPPPTMKYAGFDLIVPMLQRIGSTKWVPVIFVLLERFAGLEELIDLDEDLPANNVQAILAALPSGASDEAIAEAFSRMNCFTYRVKSPISMWNPLEQQFAAFVHAHKGHIKVFQWDCEYPDPAIIRAWLLEQVSNA